jgi:hypothetical protein
MLGFIPNNYFHLNEQKKNEVSTHEVDERERASLSCLGCKSQPSG